MGDALHRDLPDSYEAPHLPTHFRRSWPLTLATASWFATFGFFLLSCVVRTASMFEQVKVPMPGPTQILYAVASFFVGFPWLWVVLGIGISWFVGRTCRPRLFDSWFWLFLLGSWGLALYAYALPFRSLHGGIGSP